MKPSCFWKIGVCLAVATGCATSQTNRAHRDAAKSNPETVLITYHVKAGKDAWRCVKVAVIDPPRNKDSGNRSDAKFKGNNKSVKIGKARAGVSSRSTSSMPR